MGKGDIKTAKGKRVRGSYGKTRPRKTSSTSVSAAPKVKKVKADTAAKSADKKAATRKTTAKKAATKKTSSESAE